jgi:hypothetical protein
MAFTEDLSPLFADFGVTVRHGAVTAQALFDRPAVDSVGGAMLTDYALTLASGDLPELGSGETVSIAGTAYRVREVFALDDGALKRATLTPA